MKKLKLILLFSILFPFTVLSQKYDTLCLKEDYDFYTDALVFNTYNLCKIHPDKDWSTFGDGVSKILEGYIDMYMSTKDKAYLYKFVHQSLCVIENRNDINPESSTKTPKWSETPNTIYGDGYIIGTMSRFVHLIKVLEPALMDLPLYQFDQIKPELYQINTCNCNFSGITFKNFGEYAEWLEQKDRETLDFFINNGGWSYEKGILQPEGEVVINMQTGFARCLLFTGLSSGNKEYLRMADTLASLHKSMVVFNDLCTKNRYSASVFRYNAAKNSYWWYHAGWRVTKRECARSLLFKVPNYNTFTQFVEDISHGAVVLLFPYDYYKYRPGKFFSEKDMIRFKNTFKNNIYDNGKYNMGVDGSNGTTYPEVRYNAEQLKGIRETCSLGYANWSDFDIKKDSSELDVFEIIIKDYSKLFLNQQTLSKEYGGQINMGHAQITARQWQREKVNLSLYNRDIVYNQDFFVPGNITIDPKYNRDNINKTKQPYADPKTFTDNGNLDRFVLEPGVNVNITAGGSVKIKPGFYAKKGSILRISANKQIDK